MQTKRLIYRESDSANIKPKRVFACSGLTRNILAGDLRPMLRESVGRREVAKGSDPLNLPAAWEVLNRVSPRPVHV